MHKKIFSVSIVFLFLLSFLLLPLSPSSSHSGDIIQAKQKITDPVIDGNFNLPTEWNDATILHINSPFEIYVYIKYDSNYLYVCEDTTGDSTNSGVDMGNLMFDTDHNGAPTPEHDDIFSIAPGYGEIHGVDDPGAGYNPVVHCWFDGHPGLEGAAGFGSTPNSVINHRIYEFKIPLTLINVTIGTTLGFAIYVIDDSGGGSVAFWPNGLVFDTLTTWGDLVFTTLFPEQITITNLIQTPMYPTPINPVTISANISCINSIENATVWYSPNSTTWIPQPMTLQDGSSQDGFWDCIIPEYPWNTTIEYFLVVFNNISESLKLGPFYYSVLGYQNPIIENVTQLPSPSAVSSSDIVKINCSITDMFSGVNTVVLYYSINNSGSYIPVSMNLIQGSEYTGIWNGSIPNFLNNTVISYFIFALNNENLNSSLPENAPANSYGYIVGNSDTEPPLFGLIRTPTIPSWNEPASIQAWVNSTREISGVKNLTIAYKINNGPEINAQMNYSGFLTILNSTFLVFTYQMNALPYNTTVQYNVTSYDVLNNALTLGPDIYIVNDSVTPLSSFIDQPTNPSFTTPLNFKVNLDEETGSGIKNCTLYYEFNETIIYPHESIHPYPNNYNNNWTYTHPNATRIILKFQRIETEANSDFLVIYDYNNTELFRFNGSYRWDQISQPLTVEIPGNMTKIQLVSDFLVTRWGYKLLECIAVVPQAKRSMNLTEGTIFLGNWTASLEPLPQNTRLKYSINAYDFEENPSTTTESIVVVGETTPPNILSITRNKPNPHTTDSVNITASAIDDYFLPYNASAFINYTLSTLIGSYSYYQQMTVIPNNGDYYQNERSWFFVIPGIMSGSKITYRVVVQDLYSNKNSSTEYWYLVDDDEPYIQTYQYPLDPTHLNNVSIQASCLDGLFLNYYGSGIKNVSIVYSSEADYSIESSHPVSNNYQHIWNLTYANAIQLRLHFNRIELENTFDYIYIYDADWNPIQNYTSIHIDEWTDWINSSTLHLKILTDYSEPSWGFSVDKIEYYEEKEMILINGNNQSGTWEFEFNSLSYGQIISYYIQSYDFYENFGRDPVLGTYSFEVGDTSPPIISDIQLEIPQPEAYQDIPLSINFVENGSGIQNVTLCISTNGGLTWSRICMDLLNSTTYNATLPGQIGGSTINYYFVIYDKAGNSRRNPENGCYSITFSEESLPKELIPLWVFYLIMGLLVGLIIGEILFYRGKRVITSPPPPKTPPPKPSLEAVPDIVTPPKPVPSTEQIPPPKKGEEMKVLENELNKLIRQAADALDQNNPQEAHQLLLKAADIATVLENEELVKIILEDASEARKRMDFKPHTPPELKIQTPPKPSEISPPATSPEPAEQKTTADITKPPITAIPEVPPPPTPKPPTSTDLDPTYTKWTLPCPHCGKWISKKAINCPYCRKPLYPE